MLNPQETILGLKPLPQGGFSSVNMITSNTYGEKSYGQARQIQRCFETMIRMFNLLINLDEAYKPNRILLTIKHSSSNVMLWERKEEKNDKNVP